MYQPLSGVRSMTAVTPARVRVIWMMSSCLRVKASLTSLGLTSSTVGWRFQS